MSTSDANVSPYGESSPCRFSQHSNAIFRHSNSSALQKRRSSKLLVTSEFKGVHSKQDKATHATKQLSSSKLCSKTNESISSNGISIDNINDEDIESTISANGIAKSQEFCNSPDITSVGIEETEIRQKQSYVVLVGNRVRTVNTKLCASLPVHNKFMVKQREQNLFGVTKVKLVLKSSHERLVFHCESVLLIFNLYI